MEGMDDTVPLESDDDDFGTQSSSTEPVYTERSLSEHVAMVRLFQSISYIVIILPEYLSSFASSTPKPITSIHRVPFATHNAETIHSFRAGISTFYRQFDKSRNMVK